MDQPKNWVCLANFPTNTDLAELLDNRLNLQTERKKKKRKRSKVHTASGTGEGGKKNSRQKVK
jgi:hypothetical protein